MTGVQTCALPISVDAVGNMFIGSGGPEQPNHFGKITRVNASGNLVWSHVFTSTELRGLAISADTIYAASFNENLIVRLSLDEQTLPSWGVVDSTANELINPVGMTFDSADNLYVTDYVSDGRTCRLHRIKDSVIQTSWAANDLYPALGPDWCPTDISRDTSGRFYLANGKGHSILRMTVSGNSILTETLPISNDVFAVPKSIVVAPDGRIIITELNQNRARILREIAGELTTDVTITDTGDVAAGLIGGPVGVAISGTHLFLTDDKSRVLKFTLGATSAQFVSAFTSTTTGPIPVLLNHPESLEIGQIGRAHV